MPIYLGDMRTPKYYKTILEVLVVVASVVDCGWRSSMENSEVFLEYRKIVFPLLTFIVDLFNK